jgi:hypothetical protein
MKELIQKTRHGFGNPLRKFSFWQRWYNKIHPPSWMDTKTDGLANIYRDYKLLLEQGLVVWGQIVQANSVLFEKGPDDAPAALLFSMDSDFDGNIQSLEEMAQYMYSFKNEDTSEMSEELKHFIDVISDEYIRVFNQPLPDDLTGDKEVYFTSIMIHRKHIPGRCLKQGAFPILAAPSLTDQVMPLPEKYWSPELVQAWMGE